GPGRLRGQRRASVRPLSPDDRRRLVPHASDPVDRSRRQRSALDVVALRRHRQHRAQRFLTRRHTLEVAMVLSSYARRVSVAAMTLAFASIAHAQPDNFSGHWRGVLQIPSGPTLDFEVDVARNAAGGFDGSVDLPADNIKGLPLQGISVDGTTLSFYA